MTEVDLIKLVIQYGPCALVVWFAYRDWKREERMAGALDEGMKAIQLIAIKATTAITENTQVLQSMREEMSKGRDWNGKERRT